MTINSLVRLPLALLVQGDAGAQNQTHLSRRFAITTAVVLFLFVVLPFASAAPAFAAAIAQPHRLGDSAWVFGEAKDDLSSWTREQAIALTKKLCGKRAKITRDLAGPFCILVGTPETTGS